MDILQMPLTPVSDPGNPGFVPYCYTFGARYTDVFGKASDVLVRGHIPLWAQTLFLLECVKQMPIRPNETRTGLFPFAPDVPVTFRSMAECFTTDGEPTPEMTLYYERFAMEFSEPEMVHHEADTLGRTWESRKQLVLQRMLYCDIPNNVAQMLTALAIPWAASQGFML